MIFAAILAGGIGSRMNISDLPKQFLLLGNKPIVVHTLEKFLLCGRIDAIYVGAHPSWLLYMEDLVEKFVPDAKSKIHVIAGGENRNSTIMNIIAGIETDFGISKQHILITHDSVRPFVTLRMIEENIDAAIQYGACDTVVAAVDTIVCSNDGEFISEIPDRRIMYQGQTPQSFNMETLKQIYNELNETEKNGLTDACKILIFGKHKVHLVQGETSNLKITTVSDYKIAQGMLSQEAQLD